MWSVDFLASTCPAALIAASVFLDFSLARNCALFDEPSLLDEPSHLDYPIEFEKKVA